MIVKGLYFFSNSHPTLSLIQPSSKLLPVPTQQNGSQIPAISISLPLHHHFTVAFFLPKDLEKKLVKKILYWSQTFGKNLPLSPPQVKILAI